MKAHFLPRREGPSCSSCAALSHSVMSDPCDRMDRNHQTPLSMEFSRQEYWSGLARILEWVAMLSSRRSSERRDRTQVCCIAGRFFTVSVTRKPLCWALLVGKEKGRVRVLVSFLVRSLIPSS